MLLLLQLGLLSIERKGMGEANKLWLSQTPKHRSTHTHTQSVRCVVASVDTAAGWQAIELAYKPVEAVTQATYRFQHVV